MVSADENSKPFQTGQFRGRIMRGECILRTVGMCLIAGSLLIAAPAAADPQSDYEACATTPAEAAIPFCTRAIESGEFDGEDLAGIYLNRGLRFDYKGDLDLEKGDNDRAKSNYDLALADYDEAIQIEPTFFKAFNNRGGVYKKLKNYDQAIADYDEAIRLNSEYAVAFTGRCAVYDEKGEYERAIADCNRALRIDPRHSYAFYNRGLAYLYKKDFDRAIADYSETIRLSPKAWQPLRNRGAAYFGAKNYDSAMTDFDAVMRLNPKSAAGLYGRGITKLKKGDTAGGNADIAAAKELRANVAEQWVSDTHIQPEG
jgi:tetratricopeptide (TPR) repeat protein